MEVDESLFPSAADAATADDVWSGGQEEAKRGRPVGTFQAIVLEAELCRSQSSDRLQIHYKLLIAAGEYKDVELHKYDGLETKQQASITQQQLNRLGIKTEGLNLKKLPAVLLALIDKKVNITTRQNKEFFNIYFQRMLGEAVGDAKKPGDGF